MRTGIVVTAVGGAGGSHAIAAAVACAASDPDSAALLVDLSDAKRPRPGLFATAAARRLEDRLASHLPEASVAARGRICAVGLDPDERGLERLPAALAIGRDSLAVVHLPPALFRPVLSLPTVCPESVLLRADLPGDRALTALAACELIAAGIRVAVLKRRPGWIAAQLALGGNALRPGLPGWALKRVLGPR